MQLFGGTKKRTLLEELHPRTLLVMQLHFVISLAIVVWSFISKMPAIVTIEVFVFLLPIVLLISSIIECSHRGNCSYLASTMIFIYLFLAIMFILIQSERKHTLLFPMPS